MAIDITDQPVFTLGIDAGSCRFQVRLNDVPIFDSAVARPYDVAFPVSEWILRGPNRIAALVEPPAVWSDDGEEQVARERFDPAESALKLTLWVKRNGAPRSERQAITTLQFVARHAVPPQLGFEASGLAGRFDSRRGFQPDEQGGDVFVSEVTFERGDEPPHEVLIRRDVGMRSPFAPWAWESGEPIADDDETLASLRAEAQRVWGRLLARDVAAVEALQATKAAEYRAAYYLDDAGVDEALPLAELMQTDELTLQPLPDELELEVFGHGRLARLVDEDGDPPIVFVSEDDVGYFVGMTYCRLGGAWVLVR